MIIIEDKRYIEAHFSNEQEIEDLVINNSEYFFGPSSIFIPKKLIKTKDGFGTIPDGFAIDITSRIWYIVEAELNHHSLWDHIAPQVTRQILAVNQPVTRQLLTEILIQMITEDDSIKEKFDDEDIEEIDIRRVINEIFQTPPIIGMPIDEVSNDLKEWAETLRNDVRLWIVKKYTQFENPEIIAYNIPEEFRPTVEITQNESKDSSIKSYDVTLLDLVEDGFLHANQTLLLKYQPRGGNQHNYEGIVRSDGTIEVMGSKFSTPSYSALFCIQNAGSNRRSVNGWTKWKTEEGSSLFQIRADYLNKKKRESMERKD